MIRDRRHAGIKLHQKFSDPSKEWAPLLDRLTKCFGGNVCRSKKKMAKTGREREQVKNFKLSVEVVCGCMQRAADMLAPVFQYRFT